MLALNLTLILASYNSRRGTRSLIGSFLGRGLRGRSYDFGHFDRLAPATVVSFGEMGSVHRRVGRLPCVGGGVSCGSNAFPSALVCLETACRLAARSNGGRRLARAFCLSGTLAQIVTFGRG